MSVQFDGKQHAKDEVLHDDENNNSNSIPPPQPFKLPQYDNVKMISISPGLSVSTGKAQYLGEFHERGPAERICFNTGVSWGLGCALGGAYGVVEGVRQPAVTMKLRFNSILNASGKRGSKLGNALGVITLFSGFTQMGLKYVRDEDDLINVGISGAIAGALYKLPQGPRQVAIGSAAVAAIVTAASYVARALDLE